MYDGETDKKANGPLFYPIQDRLRNLNMKNFPGDPVVETPRFRCRKYGLIPGGGTKITHAACGNQERKREGRRKGGREKEKLNCER